MDDLSFGNRIAASVTAPIYAFLYFTRQNRFLGITISGLLKNLPLLFFLLALVLRWPFIWFVVGIILAVLVRLLYWKAKRAGYIIFMTNNSQVQPAVPKPITENQKVVIQATGTFSVKDWEAYVVRRTAEYWRVPIGDHTLMVEQSKGQFLYQFVQPGALEQVKSGQLCFGTHSDPALSITYQSTWGPESEEVSFMFYSPNKNNKSAKLRRKIILSFKNEAQKDAVWASFLVNANQPIDEEL